MPRLPTALIRRAKLIHPYLHLLLRPCRDLPSARNELRWLKEYVQELEEKATRGRRKPPTLLKLCKERALGRPLQYILGNQPFGELDILCRKGVLIPRQETEQYTMALAERLITCADKIRESKTNGQKFRILDLCSGSGCIALLLYSMLQPHFAKLEIVGVDLSDTAVALARRNLEHNTRSGNLRPSAAWDVSFLHGDVREIANDPTGAPHGDFDMVISNPPYIDEDSFRGTTSMSVRHYEPKSALVPIKDDKYDSLYPAINRIARIKGAKILLCEIDSLDNLDDCFRTMLALSHDHGRLFYYWRNCQIWCDQPGESLDGKKTLEHEDTAIFYVTVGTGNPRAFLSWDEVGGEWLRAAGIGKKKRSQKLSPQLAKRQYPGTELAIDRLSPQEQTHSVLMTKRSSYHEEPTRALPGFGNNARQKSPSPLRNVCRRHCPGRLTSKVLPEHKPHVVKPHKRPSRGAKSFMNKIAPQSGSERSNTTTCRRNKSRLCRAATSDEQSRATKVVTKRTAECPDMSPSHPTTSIRYIFSTSTKWSRSTGMRPAAMMTLDREDVNRAARPPHGWSGFLLALWSGPSQSNIAPLVHVAENHSDLERQIQLTHERLGYDNRRRLLRIEEPIIKTSSHNSLPEQEKSATEEKRWGRHHQPQNEAGLNPTLLERLRSFLFGK